MPTHSQKAPNTICPTSGGIIHINTSDNAPYASGISIHNQAFFFSLIVLSLRSLDLIQKASLFINASRTESFASAAENAKSFFGFRPKKLLFLFEFNTRTAAAPRS